MINIFNLTWKVNRNPLNHLHTSWSEKQSRPALTAFLVVDEQIAKEVDKPFDLLCDKNRNDRRSEKRSKTGKNKGQGAGSEEVRPAHGGQWRSPPRPWRAVKKFAPQGAGSEDALSWRTGDWNLGVRNRRRCERLAH